MKIVLQVLSSLLEVKIFLNVNPALMAISPNMLVHLHVINVEQVPMLTRLLAIPALMELSLPMAEQTTVHFALQDLSPKIKALLTVLDALLVATNILDTLVTTALQALILLWKAQIALLHV